jgi:hypothetical protein
MFEIKVKNEKLVIEIELETAKHSMENGLESTMGVMTKIDIKKFAPELINSLLREEEDGTTLLHKALDDAAYNAFENGDEGIELVDECDY